MFTDAYPYARADEWKRFELEVFSDYFDEIHLVPLWARVAEPDPQLPSNIDLLPASFGIGENRVGARSLAALAGLAAHPSLYDVGLSARRARALVGAWADVQLLMKTETYTRRVAPLLAGSHLYFFWGRGYADILPLLPPQQQAASLVRMHRYDLYPEVGGGYIPFHSAIVRKAGLVAPISEDGVQSLKRRFPAEAGHIRCLRLGTVPKPLGPYADDGVLKLVSCAHAVPVKRLHLIAEALAHADRPVRWRHIGDGPELQRLRDIAATLPANVTVELPGAILPSEVPEHYQSHPYDLFLNVSASEGVPVSIMEAMSAGIPTLATDVGGTRELVTPATGRLLPEDATPALLWQTIDAFAAQPKAQIMKLRTASHELVRDRYDIRANARLVAEAIRSLPVAS